MCDDTAQPAPVGRAPVEGAPVGGAPVEGAPVEGAPVEAAPVEGAPVEAAPVEGAPVEAAPVEAPRVEGAPVEAAPVGPVSVSRTIEAPAETLFAILTDTGNHPAIDGSGMLQAARPDYRITGLGDIFVMAMHNQEMGHYEMRNHVVEYEEGSRLAWEPVLSAASRQEDRAEIGDPAHQRWAFTLTPDGPGRTVVTETYDCSRCPPWLQKAVKGGARWSAAMAATLEKLDALATARR